MVDFLLNHLPCSFCSCGLIRVRTHYTISHLLVHAQIHVCAADWWLYFQQIIGQAHCHSGFPSRGFRSRLWGEPVGELSSWLRCTETYMIDFIYLKKKNASRLKLPCSFLAKMYSLMALNVDQKFTNKSLACAPVPSRCLYKRLSNVIKQSSKPVQDLYVNCMGSQEFPTTKSVYQPTNTMIQETSTSALCCFKNSVAPRNMYQ